MSKAESEAVFFERILRTVEGNEVSGMEAWNIENAANMLRRMQTADAENERLRAALKPFAERAARIEQDHPGWYHNECNISLETPMKDLIAARDAVEQEGVGEVSFRPIDPFNDICPFCLDELRRGVPEDGKCRHEEILTTYPHLRFNAYERLDAATLADSEARFAARPSGQEAATEEKK